MTEPTLEFVHELARTRHAGQTDKRERDYYEHHLAPIARLLEPLGEHAVMAGLLHDIVEDTDTTLDELRELGIPEPVVSAVDSVTRRVGESYDDLIARACADPLGVHVKLADNTHNLMGLPALAASDVALAERLMRKYVAARDVLVVAAQSV